MSRVTDFLLGRITASPATRDAEPASSRMIGFTLDGGVAPYGVNSFTALSLSSVWRCLDILANGVSQLGWQERRGNLDLPPSRLVQKPQYWRTRREWTSLVVSTLALFDVCYLLKVGGTDSEGVPIGLWPLDPGFLRPKTIDYYSLEPAEVFYLGDMTISRDQLVILHRSPQPCINDTLGGVIRLARASFAAAISAENYASRYWQAGGSPNVVLETDAKLPAGMPEQLSDRWRERRARGPDYAPVLDSGIHAKTFGADPTTAAAVEARKEQTADIGRYFGIPTTLLNAPAGDSETYTTTEAQGIHLVTYTLANYINAIEDAISDQLPGGRRLFIDPAPLFRGTAISRAQSAQLALAGQAWMDVDEVREEYGLPPREIAPAPRPSATPVPTGGSNG